MFLLNCHGSFIFLLVFSRLFFKFRAFGNGVLRRECARHRGVRGRPCRSKYPQNSHPRSVQATFNVSIHLGVLCFAARIPLQIHFHRVAVKPIFITFSEHKLSRIKWEKKLFDDFYVQSLVARRRPSIQPPLENLFSSRVAEIPASQHVPWNPKPPGKNLNNGRIIKS